MNRFLFCIALTGCGLSPEDKWDSNDSASDNDGIFLGAMRINLAE